MSCRRPRYCLTSAEAKARMRARNVPGEPCPFVGRGGSVARRLKAGAASHRKKLAFGLVPQRQSREETHEEGRTRSGLRSADPVCRLSSGSKKAVGHRRQGLDNPFFEAIHQGCEKWNKENANSPYHCFYTGPASTSDEAGEAQIVGDILGKSDTAAVAISPSNAPMIANSVKSANPKVPIMTIDADLKKEDSALRKTYLGTDNYQMGYRLGEYVKKAKTKGGAVCFIEGNAAADNILRRASGTRDALSGKKGLDRLKGEGGWTEIAGCPVFTNDDGPKGVQAMSDILTANPKLDAFVIEGGWPLFGAPQPYRQLTD